MGVIPLALLQLTVVVNRRSLEFVTCSAVSFFSFFSCYDPRSLFKFIHTALLCWPPLRYVFLFGAALAAAERSQGMSISIGAGYRLPEEKNNQSRALDGEGGEEGTPSMLGLDSGRTAVVDDLNDKLQASVGVESRIGARQRQKETSSRTKPGTSHNKIGDSGTAVARVQQAPARISSRGLSS